MSDQPKRISRGRRAKALLDDELLKEAFSSLEASYVKAWRESHALDDKGREKLFIAINVVSKVRDHLQQAAADGRIAEEELKTI